MRLCFITPRYGDSIVGGAERLIRDYAERLVVGGHKITVLTTCATDHLTWRNHHPPGKTTINGVTVHRYQISHPTDPSAMVGLYAPVHQGTAMPPEFEMRLMQNMGHSESLLEAIDAFAESNDALCFCPYLFATTVLGVAVRPDRSLIWPCFHDEPFARVQMVQQAMRSAAGLLFNTRAERQVAEQVVGALPSTRVVGCGIDTPALTDDNAFRDRHGLTGDFIAYAGRREWGKNFHLLLECTAAFGDLISAHDPVALAVMGRGDFAIPSSVARFVHDLGYVEREEMFEAIAASVAVVNLSTNESLSYLLLEGWACGVPAIVHSDCAVTRSQCEESGGGLWVRSVEEFAEALGRIRRDSSLRRDLGLAGRAYVRSVYSWPAAVARLENAVTDLVAAA